MKRTKKTWGGLRTKTVTDKYVTGGLSTSKVKVVPIALEQVFPGGGQTVKMTNSLRYEF